MKHYKTRGPIQIQHRACLYQIRWQANIDGSRPCLSWYCEVYTDAGPLSVPGASPWLCSAARVTDNSSRWIILWGDERNRQWGPEQVALPLCLKQWIASASFQLLTKCPSPDKVQELCLGVWWAAACSTQRIKKQPSLVTEEGLAVIWFTWIIGCKWISLGKL